MALRVLVVGGGIMGASAAWHLTHLGAKVTVLEQKPEPARGATRWSYGWVGTSSAFPSDSAIPFASTLDAISEFYRLERGLGSLPVVARGAIVWLDTEEQTLKLIQEQRSAGVDMKSLCPRQVGELEPRLAHPPSIAAWAPNDFAVEPVALTTQLLAAAREAGAETAYYQNIEAIETRNGRTIGVRCNGLSQAADVVLLANGAAAIPLAAQVGIDLPLITRPAVLMRFTAKAGLARHLLYGEGLELRPGENGRLVCAEDCPDTGEAGLANLADQTARIIKRMFATSSKPTLCSANIGHRPMTRNGLPLQTFLAGIRGLYALVAHPGVILAPRLGRMAAKDIWEGD